MKIISTFNRKLYEFSGKGMIQSAQDKLPDAEIIIYDEQIGENFSFETVNVNDLPEVQQVFKDKSPRRYSKLYTQGSPHCSL